MTSLTPYLLPKMESHAINTLINDEYRAYLIEVQKTKDFDGEHETHDSSVRMEFSIPFGDFVISYECIVSVYMDNGSPVSDIEDIEIIPDFEWERIEREVEEMEGVVK